LKLLKINRNILECKIITGKFKGNVYFIPRINLTTQGKLIFFDCLEQKKIFKQRQVLPIFLKIKGHESAVVVELKKSHSCSYNLKRSRIVQGLEY